MNKETIQALEDLIAANEELKGYRVIIDYAIALACEYSNNPSVQNKLMTEHAETLYKGKYK